MMYARLQVTSRPGAEVESPCSRESGLPGYPNSPSRLSGRLSVLDDCIRGRSFDTVQLCFRGWSVHSVVPGQWLTQDVSGLILSTVGDRSALEEIITLTDIKTLSDFRATPASTPDDSEKAQHADFYFELPSNVSAAEGKLRYLPISSHMTGTTRAAAQDAALSDNRAIRGDCDVSYWIEAQFRLAGQQVGFLSEHVKISSLYPRLRASLPRGLPLTMSAKPDLLARIKLQKRPDMTVTLYEPDMAIERDPQTGKRQIVLPLAVAMEMQSPASGTRSIDSRQSFKCSVEAKWEVNSRFSTARAPPNGGRTKPDETIHKVSSASTQKSTILFRPLPVYDDATGPKVKNAASQQTSYVATSQLDLAVPDAVSQPSLRWEHLSRSYALNLSLNFHGIQGAPKYSLHSNIPLWVSAYGSKADDALKDDILVNVTEADEDEDEDGHEGQEHGPSREHGQARQTQRPPPRRTTPPPPYFR